VINVREGGGTSRFISREKHGEYPFGATETLAFHLAAMLSQGNRNMRRINIPETAKGKTILLLIIAI
jgi:hypothetical protein